MPFEFAPFELPGLVLIKPRVFADERGSFAEIFAAPAFREAGITETFVQDNLSHSRQGVLRGMHFQRPPMAQGKLVSVIRGEIFDVAIDLREGSPTLHRWAAARLSDDNAHMLYIPAGFAHGFCVLSQEADVVYKVTADYAPASEGGLVWNDPDIGVDWPLEEPILAERDARLPLLKDLAVEFQYRP